MDRLTEKLTLAAGVNARVAEAVEDEADALILREKSILDRSAAAFKPHHDALDARAKELDRFEDALQTVENADIFGRRTTTTGNPDTLEPGSTASAEPGVASDAN